MFRSDVERDLVPLQPGVYVFKSQGDRILYIGKAKQIRKRLQQYFSPSSLWKQDMVSKAKSVEWFPVDSEQEALILETQMIQHHTPPYNNLIKGNSSYVYIKISNHPFPRISLSRYKKKDKADYIGPKARKGDLRKFLHMVRYLFQWRSCSNKQFDQGVVCSDYYFGLCKGWCAYSPSSKKGKEESGFGFKPAMDRDQACEDSEETMRMLRALFSGRINKFQTYVKKKIDHAVEQENFEWAVKLRDIYTYAENLLEKQTVVFSQDISGVYCKIDTHGNFLLWVVISIVQGRIVDIIGFHEHKNDITKQQLLAQIQREYSIDSFMTSDHEGEGVYSFNKKRLAKKSLQVLDDHANRFLQGYTFSRFASEDPASRMALLQTLKDYYELPEIPKTIECVDISHFGGEDTVAGLTAMSNGVLAKNRYKRYKINTVSGGDDYGALKEVILRRFGSKSQSKNYPDLFVIDGGKGQLGVIKTIFEEQPNVQKKLNKVQFTSLGKGKARSRKEKLQGAGEILFCLDQDGTIREYPFTYDDADKLLILLRDESHRFANSYRKKLSSKKFSR